MDMRKTDGDPQETVEWLEALAGVLANEGPDRAHFLLEQLIDATRRAGGFLPFSAEHRIRQHDSYRQQPRMPGDHALEWRIRCRRWNAMAMVVRANRKTGRTRRPYRQFRVGGHAVRRRLQSFLARAERRPSAATWFSIQGHSARASTRARSSKAASTEEQLDLFRMEVDGKGVVCLVSASVADAGLLAGADRVDGPRPAAGDLPGAVHEVPASIAA